MMPEDIIRTGCDYRKGLGTTKGRWTERIREGGNGMHASANYDG